MAAENKPEGLKKIRNPDRMYRTAVGYTGHVPPKSVSDDTDNNNEHGHLKIYLPKKLLECLPKCSSLPKERHRWNTNEEIAAYLITFEKHEEWLTTSPKTRPQNGSMILYNRKKVKYRKDGYCWKKRKDGKTTREDHMKLKVQGVECLYGCYVHSSIIPTFHRRCYWLLQNPDIVLVHYLNVPAIEDCGKPCGPILCSINTDKKEWAKWTKEELIGQLKPMFHGIKWTCSNGNSSTGFSAEQLVQQILDSHQTKPPPRTHNCLCTGNLGAGSSLHHKCNSAKHRIISPKVDPRTGSAYSSTHSEVQNNDVSEGKTEHSHGGSKNGRAGGDGAGGTGGREKRNGKVHKPALLHQNSMEVSSTNQVEVPDTTQSSPVSISSGLNSDPDMADSPVVTGMGHVASVMNSLSQSATVFMSEDPVYSMSPTVDPNAHLLGADTASSSLVLAVTADSHKFAFAGAVGVGLADAGSTDELAMLSTASVSEELVLSSNLEAGNIKLPETNMNFDPDCFLNNPKQGQTYGGNGLKTEEGNRSSCSNGGLRCSPPLNDNGYVFNPSLVKNIKTEDTSFEQQLAKEGGYQVGEVVSDAVGISGSSSGGSAQNSLALTPTGSLLPSGGGLSPSTTLEQMDFSAIDAKQDYPSSVMSAGGYGQAISSSHLANQGHSPSFFLQGSPQSQTHQNNSGPTQNSHDSNAYMGLVKTDSTGTNGHLHHRTHPSQHTAANCNGGSPSERNGQAGSLQLLQYQNRFPTAGQEHEEVGGLEQPAGAEQGGGGGVQEKDSDCLMAQPGRGGEPEGVGAAEHYLQQPTEAGGVGQGSGGTSARAESGTLCNNTEGNGTTNSPHQQLQPLLQGAGLVQGLFSTVGAHQSLGSSGTNGGGSMEINLDHFDVSFGNQFSDLINDFISVEGGSGAAVVPGGSALYGHQLMTHSGTEGQVSSGTTAQQGADEGARGYNSSELCLQPCCSPQSTQAGAVAGEAGQLSYMQVAEAVSAAVAHGNMAMLQATGRLFVVTDYSPEWSYPEGGVKVLITGPWQEASSEYTCLFDQITVPASLIQPGVLRCYCPAHDTGLVTLQVAASSQIISNSVVFEYKARALPALPSSQHDWLSLDDNQFRMSILERLEQMERRMAEMAGQQQQQQGGGGSSESGGTGTGGGEGGRSNSEQAQFSPGQSQSQGQGPAGSSFESRVVVVCEKMMNRACWAKSKHLIHSKTFRGMTLLHLAAAQGYTTLIQTLIKWRTKHADSIDLELEVDPLNVDHFSCTPLMWACALGHMEAAVVLYKWDRRALAIPDSLGRLPLAIARSRGHTKLAECLESLQREEQQSGALNTTASMPFSTSTEASAAEGWMNVWGTELKDSSITCPASSSSSDLRRPRSEPSSFYSSVSHGDAPLSKKHKPNPETLQTRPSKSCSAPLGLEEQAHKPKTCPSKPREGTVEKEQGDGEQSQTKLGSACGGGRWGSRQAAGRRVPTVGLGKERLANRLRLREVASAGTISDLRTSQEDLENTGDLQNMNMMTLAEEVIEATSDRIKRESFVASDTTLDGVGVSSTMSWLASYLGDAERFLFNKPLTHSPGLASVHGGGQPELDGPLGKLGFQSPTEWTALLNASHNKEERDLTQLALSDPEQRELYEAARQVQNTFRKYKGRPLREQQELAAAVIQRCYKRYKQLTWIALKYALYKKMTLAAILIQSKFRSYHEQKKFQQSRRAAVLIQQYYRSYKELSRPNPRSRATAAALVQHKLRSSLLTKRQDQAARKIMRFLLRCRHSPLMDHRLFKRGERIEKGQGT
ncbi:calmodulin-binding transcription activator 1 isoform X4 [Pimephales promelas]|uniref:calmodulin-binding transcription activator 1 isoform X4 n=1 Tax=Pimephales promelas TaxID=90988 RepID=UPI00195571CD|nr:calmodulin-binding transcription activator 1 isoform X4 [Pimephales promelas]